MTGYLIFGVICLATLLVGLWAAKKVKTTDDFWVGGRSLGKIVTTCTQAATFIGGGMTVGWISMGYMLGYGAFWYGIPQCLGIFVAAFFLVKPFRKSTYTSLPDYFQDIYRNKYVNLLLIICSVVAPLTWVAGQFAAAGRIMQAVLGIDFATGVIIAGVVVILYSALGGFMAVAYTDTLQFGVLVVLFAIVAPMPIFQAGGVGKVIENVPEYMTKPFEIHGMASITILIWMFMGLTESLSLQTVYQRIYAAKTASIARFALVVTALLTIAWGVLTPIIGMAIKTLNPDLNPDLSFSWFLANRVPEIVGYAFFACVIMATMSTADSMLNSVALNIGYDIYQKHLNPGASDKRSLLIGQIITVVFGLVSMYWAMQGGLIMSFFGYAASITSGPMVAALFVTAFFRKLRTAKGLIIGLIAGMIVGTACIFLPVVKDILAGGVMFSFLTTAVVALLIGTTCSRDGEYQAKDGETSTDAETEKNMPIGRMMLQAFAPFNWRSSR